MIGSKKRGALVLREIDKLAFKAWAETGSLDNARSYFEDNKILNRRGTQYSTMGIRYCAMRYMVNCYDEAREFIIHEYHKHNLIYDDQMIDFTLIGYAMEILKSRDLVMKWVEEHGLMNDTNIDYVERRIRHVDTSRKRTALPVS